MKNIIILLFLLGASCAIKAQYTEIAVNKNGGLWLLGADKTVTSVNSDFIYWSAYRGGGLGLHLRSNGTTPLLVGMNSHFFNTNGQVWTELPGGGFGKLIVKDHKTDKYWCIGSDEAIYYLGENKWQKYAWDSFIDLAVYDGVVYAILKDGNKIMRSSKIGQWEHLAQGLGSRITVDVTTGLPWCIGTTNGIHRFNGTWWEEYKGNGRGKEIAVNNEVPYIIANDGSVWQGNTTEWTRVTKKIKGGIYQIRLIASNLRLLDADKNKVNELYCTVQLWKGEAGRFQSWYIMPLKNGRYKIKINLANSAYSYKEGYTLTAERSNMFNNECPINLTPTIDSDFKIESQEWDIIDYGKAGVQFILHVSGKALDAHSDDITKNGCRVQLWDKCDKCASQMWQLWQPSID